MCVNFNVCGVNNEVWIRLNIGLLAVSDNCPEGWVSWDNSCYKLETDDNLRFSEDNAREHCKKTYNSHLMVPNSREESVFIDGYLKGMQVRDCSALIYLTLVFFCAALCFFWLKCFCWIYWC